MVGEEDSRKTFGHLGKASLVPQWAVTVEWWSNENLELVKLIRPSEIQMHLTCPTRATLATTNSKPRATKLLTNHFLI